MPLGFPQPDQGGTWSGRLFRGYVPKHPKEHRIFRIGVGKPLFFLGSFWHVLKRWESGVLKPSGCLTGMGFDFGYKNSGRGKSVGPCSWGLTGSPEDFGWVPDRWSPGGSPGNLAGELVGIFSVPKYVF